MQSAKKFLAVVLLLALLTATVGDCFAETVTAINEAEQQRQTIEYFAYKQIFDEYSLLYDTFDAALYLDDGTEILGIGFSDYSAFYEAEDESVGYFPAGFIADVGYTLPEMSGENGLMIENLDSGIERYQYVYAIDIEPFMEHAIVDNLYVRYGVDETGGIVYDIQQYQRGYCDETLGALFSYDENRYVFNPDIGEFLPINGISLYSEIDYQVLEDRINQIIEQQNLNFSRADVVTSVTFAQGAVVSYLLSMQEETFLGYNVSELVEIAETLDPMQCVRLTPDGMIFIDIEDDIPEGPGAATKWLVGMTCGVVILGSIALELFIPAARPFSAAISGAAVEAFMQVVVQNQNVEDINWRKVGIAAASGALLAWVSPLAASNVTGAVTKVSNEAFGKLAGYGVQTLSNATVAGATKVALANIDGQEAGWNVFWQGALIGGVSTLALDGLGSALGKVAPKVLNRLSGTKVGKWANKVIEKVDGFIGDHQVHLKNSKIEDILNPKSINEAARQAQEEINKQRSLEGGGYNALSTDGNERHELISHDSYCKGTGTNNTRTQNDLPSIRMSREDHKLTASYGIGRDARLWRQEDAELISQGQYQRVLERNIKDIREKFGHKYDVAIAQTIQFARERGWIMDETWQIADRVMTPLLDIIWNQQEGEDEPDE